MASYTQKALESIAQRYEGVDNYVKEKLGYKSTEQVHDAMMALQVDAAALAIDNIEQGRALIIGDQTGVGKGRQAAAIIRYAMKQGKIPVFVTQKPNLFTDMYDDLADIGITSFKPLIMNSDAFISKNGVKLHNIKSKTRTDLLNELADNASLPASYDALFLTYSQISSDTRGNKKAVLSAIAKKSIFVLDESHTASGSDSKLGKAFQEYVTKAAGVAYLSATYAKRPDNMLLYSRTDLGLATETKEQLVDAITVGGIGMQTYIAGKLAEAGQMIRRERSFEGISIDNVILEDSTGKVKKGFDEVTKALRAIQDLSAAWARYVKDDLATQIQRKSGLDTSVAGNKADKSINVTLFSSVVHNYIAQLSLGLKAKHIADLAIKAIKQGKRPVIAIENTMGAALSSYMMQTGANIGDSAKSLTFATLLEKVADGVLAYSVKPPGERKGVKTYVPISEVEDSYVKFLYEEVMNVVKAMDVTDVPASPIDAMRYELTKQGYSVAEITGRDKYIDYADGSKIINKPVDEKDRRAVVDRFNSAELDVLILNQAGSTGLSLHAKKGFKDTRERYMIVGQPSLDINTFMQMLGRVNRTGQVVKPSYGLAWLDLPSEKRPAAVIAKKMNGLNANTSGNKDSATSIESIDMLNIYGDEVVKSFVSANFSMLRQYNDRLVELPPTDEAVYFLGKLAVLPVEQQEVVLNAVESEYKEYIEYLDATGQNELDTTEVDLDAKPIEQKVVSEGKTGAGVFAEPTYVTKANVKTIGKAPKWHEVEDTLGTYGQDDFDSVVQKVKSDDTYLESLESRIDKVREQREKLKKQGKNTDKYDARLLQIEQQIYEYNGEISELKKLFSSGGDLSHGAYVRIKWGDSNDLVAAVVTGLDYNHTPGKGSPTSKSKFLVSLMLANPTAKIGFSLSRLSDGVLEGRYHVPKQVMSKIFDREAEQSGREERFIMTGNLIEAQTRSDGKGRIIPFTTDDGRVIQGMLMPKAFSPDKNLKEKIKASPNKMAEWLKYTNDAYVASIGLNTLDKTVSIERTMNDEFKLIIPKAASKGKRYWGDNRIESIFGQQAVKGPGDLVLMIPPGKLTEVVEIINSIGKLELMSAQVSDYKKFFNLKDEGFGPVIKFSKTKKKPSKGLTKAQLEQSAANFVESLNGASGVSFTVVQHQSELPNAPKEGIAQAEYQDGHVYLVSENIGSQKELEAILREEVIAHHGLNKVMDSTGYRKLLDRVIASRTGALKAQWSEVESLYKDFDLDAQAEEVVGKLAQVDRSKLGMVWTRIKSLLVSGLRRVGLLPAGSISQAEVQSVLDGIARSMRAGHKPQGPNGGNNKGRALNARVAKSKSDFGAAKLASNISNAAKNFNLKKVPELLKSAWQNNRKHALKFAPRRMITELASTLSAASQSFVDSLRKYDSLVSQMEASRNEMINRAQEVADEWRKIMSQQPAVADQLAELMHDSTLSGVDPSTETYQPAIGVEQAKEMLKLINEKIKGRNGDATFMAQQMNAKKRIESALKKEQDGSREATYNELRARYMALPEGLRGRYVDRQPGKRYEPTARRKGAQVYEPGIFEKARDVYKSQNIRREIALIQRIEDLMSDDKAAASLAAEVRAQFEMNEIDGIYFPLQRFGDYAGMVLDGDGNVDSYSMFESYSDLQEWKKQQRDLMPSDYTVIAEKRVEMTKHLDAVNPRFMNNVVEKLKGFGTEGERVRDEIYQMYLESLPEMSARKHQKHRKGTAGYSNDALRAYAHNTFHGAYDVARIENTHHMETVLDELRFDQKTARDNDNDDSYKMTDIINELQRRHEWIMNPQGSSIANTLTNVGFMWYLGATPAAALLNMTQTPILALPIMGAKYGWAQASKELAIASKEFITGKGHAEKRLTGYEKLAFDHFLDSGVIDKTLAHDLSGLAEGGIEYSPKMHKFTEMVSFMFHHTERYNREVTALAAYRMAAKRLKKAGLNAKAVHEKAIEEATDVTYKAHFDYSNANKARFMQSDTAKVLLLFRQHSINMTWRLIRDVQQSVAGSSPEIRSQARKQLAGVLGMTFLFAGAVGLPLFGVVMGMLNMAFDDEDDPFNAEAELRSFVTEHLGKEASAIIFKGFANAVTGADVSSRTSLNNLWLRDPDPSLEGKAVIQYYAEQALGPIYGIVEGVLGRAPQLWREGHIDRAAEAALPKALRDGLKAIRYHNEGVNSLRGDAVLEDTSIWQEILQASGWTPHQISEIYDQNSAYKGVERRILQRRKRLIARYALGVRLKDADLINKTLAQIAKFNSVNKSVEIKRSQLRQSIYRREQLSKKAQSGVILNEKLRDKQEDLRFI